MSAPEDLGDARCCGSELTPGRHGARLEVASDTALPQCEQDAYRSACRQEPQHRRRRRQEPVHDRYTSPLRTTTGILPSAVDAGPWTTAPVAASKTLP